MNKIVFLGVVCIKYAVIASNFTDASFVVILYFVTRVAGTEVATSGVGTILVASTDVPCTLVNI